MGSKSKRAPNFTREEVELLKKLVVKRKHEVQCKKTDKVSAERKDLTWKLIANEFNVRNTATTYRSEKILRKKYENMKNGNKKRDGLEKEHNQYGNPNETPMKIKKTEGNLHSIFRDDQISGIESVYDDCVEINKIAAQCLEGEGLLHNEINQVAMSSKAVPPGAITQDPLVYQEMREVVNNPSQQNLSSDEEITELWNQRDIDRRKKSKNRALYESSSSKRTKSSWTKLANVLEEWVHKKYEKEVNILQIEHEQRMKFMQEKHNMEMEIRRYELESKKAKFESSLN